MKEVHSNRKPTPMPLPRPREEMTLFEQAIWDMRRIDHAVANCIPLSMLTDIKFTDLSFIKSDGYEGPEDLLNKWRH
ncbi:hypothetical protein [Chitinophaga sp. sic0106]|uniref:hypothetical protein n=1 Tax=Chitinophaga sp. sic0106 TaxID=2854785 RepID=UPI001C4906DB|nr:hypothetical protein [Chitinophaga sp. sic0106]MBV7531929.1 hypothetical protein [Chitinophaga sp. sic0106]